MHKWGDSLNARPHRQLQHAGRLRRCFGAQKYWAGRAPSRSVSATNFDVVRAVRCSGEQQVGVNKDLDALIGATRKRKTLTVWGTCSMAGKVIVVDRGAR
jgi:hypothetical protein